MHTGFGIFNPPVKLRQLQGPGGQCGDLFKVPRNYSTLIQHQLMVDDWRGAVPLLVEAADAPLPLLVHLQPLHVPLHLPLPLRFCLTLQFS